MKRSAFAAVLSASFLAAFTAEATAQSGVFNKGPWIGCLTETDMDLMTQARLNKDARLFESMFDTACVALGGQEFSVLEQISPGRTRVRVYFDEVHIDLIVPVAATTR